LTIFDKYFEQDIDNNDYSTCRWLNSVKYSLF
jgi:hypothetical protein